MLASGAHALQAAPAVVSPMDSKLTMRLSNAPLREALQSFSARTGASFVVADGVDEEKLVALQTDKAKADEALEAILKPGALTYRRVAATETYLIMPAAHARLSKARRGILKEERALDLRLNIRVTHVPLRNFLDMITAETKVEFTLVPGRDRNRVTIDLKDVSARDALEAALDIKGFEIVRNESGGYTIQPGATKTSR